MPITRYIYWYNPFDMDMNIHIGRQQYMWTRMPSNNINTQSHFLRRMYEKLTYFCRESEILVSMLRFFMSSDVLLKSDGGTQQNMHFNVFVIVTRHNESIYDDKMEDRHTSAPCLTRSTYILLMASQSIADDATMTRQLWLDNTNNIILLVRCWFHSRRYSRPVV